MRALRLLVRRERLHPPQLGAEVVEGRRRLRFAIVAVANLVLSLIGIMLPFAAASQDSAAPWAPEVERFLVIVTGAGAALVVSCSIGAVYL